MSSFFSPTSERALMNLLYSARVSASVMPGGGSTGATRAAGRGGAGNGWVMRGIGGGAAARVPGRTGGGGFGAGLGAGAGAGAASGGAAVSPGPRSLVGDSSSNAGKLIGDGIVSDASRRTEPIGAVTRGSDGSDG